MNYQQLQQLESLLDTLEKDLKHQEKWRELATLGWIREIVSEQYKMAVAAERDANNTVARLMGEL